jgi:hypothetical protein
MGTKPVHLNDNCTAFFQYRTCLISFLTQNPESGGQVVLEDGRVIEESDPEITVDTVEDVQSHDEVPNY